MGRTIPSFRIAAVLEEKTWKQYRKFLNVSDRKVFDNMFSIENLYNSASSYAAIPIRIHPIMMSIVFHHYKILQESLHSNNMLLFSKQEEEDYYINNQNPSIILQKELEKWKTYSDILRKPNRDLFNQMLMSTYGYSSPIEAKGENFTTESLLMSMIFEQQYKIKKC